MIRLALLRWLTCTPSRSLSLSVDISPHECRVRFRGPLDELGNLILGSRARPDTGLPSATFLRSPPLPRPPGVPGRRRLGALLGVGATTPALLV